MNDSDDEVRERAYFYIKLLEEPGEPSVLENGYADLSTEEGAGDVVEKDDIREFIFDS